MANKLTRRESEARKEAVLDWFLKHPGATGDEVQAALSSGKLTGRPGPTLSTGVLYELRRRAAGMLRSGNLPRAAAESGPALAELRERARALQEALARSPGVSEVIVTREGARVVRMEPKEEPL